MDGDEKHAELLKVCVYRFHIFTVWSHSNLQLEQVAHSLHILPSHITDTRSLAVFFVPVNFKV